MGWLTKALSPENPSAPLWPESWLSEGSGGSHLAGIQLNELNSRSAGGVLACTRVISEAAAAYPKEIFQKQLNGKRLATEHPLWPIVHDAPNPQMTNVVFWVGIISQTCIWGNGYAKIQRDGRNMARALWPLPSGKVQPVRGPDGVLVYQYNGGLAAGGEDISPSDILHIPFLSFDGIQGYSPIQLRRQGLALNMAAERFGAMFFGKGVRPSGTLETPNVLKPEQRQNLKQSAQEANSGANALGLMLLEAGITFKPYEINNTDAQFLETRKYQLEDIARDYRVPAHMVGILERATHSNAEQLGYDFSTYTMLHWVQLIEQEVNRKLFAGSNFYVKLDMDVFLRGDFETRTTGYQVLRNCGVLSTDDINAKEGWPLIGDARGGNIRIVPLNMISLETLKKQEDEPDAPSGGAFAPTSDDEDTSTTAGGDEGQSAELKRRYAMSFARLFQDAANRTINREKRDEAFVQRTWLPVVTSMAESMIALTTAAGLKDEDHSFLADYVGAIGKRCGAWGKDQLAEITTAEFNRAYTALSERA
jgi:HK97 family phage portal protein